MGVHRFSAALNHPQPPLLIDLEHRVLQLQRLAMRKDESAVDRLDREQPIIDISVYSYSVRHDGPQ